MNHTMERTPRILTKIGLTLEFLSATFALLAYILFENFWNSDFFLKIDPTTTSRELEIIDMIGPYLKIFMLVASIIGFIIFIVNYILFSGLYKGKYSTEKARSIYTYQFIWGIIQLFFNTVTGILYLISGNQGRNDQLDKPFTREGI